MSGVSKRISIYTYYMNIALVTHSTGGGIGSVLRFLQNVISRFNGVRAETILLATSSKDTASLRLMDPRTWFEYPKMDKLEYNGNIVHHFGSYFSEIEFQRYLPRNILTKYLNQYDLVQIIGGFPAWAFVTKEVVPPVCLFAATRARNERVMLLKRSNGLKKGWLNAMNQVVDLFERKALALVDHVFAESEYSKSLYAPFVDPLKISLAPPGVDVELFKPNISVSKKGYILSVGRFEDPRKNPRLIFDAISILLNQNKSIPPVVLAGRNGPSPGDLEYAASKGVNNNIKIMTNLSPLQLSTVYQQAHIFVLSSDEEGLGITILEAMASGLPVVATDCGGPSTAVVHGETGFLIPKGDPQLMATAIQTLLDDTRLATSMGQAGRQRAIERYSIEKAGAIYIQKYKELLGLN